MGAPNFTMLTVIMTCAFVIYYYYYYYKSFRNSLRSLAPSIGLGGCYQISLKMSSSSGIEW